MHEKTLIPKSGNIPSTAAKNGALAEQKQRGPNSGNFCGRSYTKCRYEEEAEKISSNIMRMQSPFACKMTSVKCSPSREDGEQNLMSEITSRKGPGQGLDNDTRSFMEQRIGHDFGNVKVHTDGYAAGKSKELHAEAFTLGRDVFFNAGRYNPSSTEGKRLLSHELTHVIQQGEAPAVQLRTERGNGYRVDDAEDCRGNWQQIGTALAEARRMVAAASAAVQPETRRAERIRNAMQTHFHISQQAVDDRRDFNLFRNLVTVINMFRRINNGFGGTIPFECEGTNDWWFCRNTLGYVRLIFSDIHLCPSWFGLPARDKAVSVVHEMGHKYANLDDEAYEFEAGYRRLSVSDAVDNADSYACFARDVS